MATNVFDSIRQDAAGKERSVQWYQAQVKRLGTINTNQLLRQGILVNQVLPGYMYLFAYDPKLKDTLPYYDRFPLVLPFRKVPGGFYGINLHYLPYLIRMRMLRFLHEFASDKNMDEKTRLRMNWNLLQSSSRLKPVQVCVKHYLQEHVLSRFMKIPYNDWVIATQLPVERFVGEKKDVVWRQTRKKYT